MKERLLKEVLAPCWYAIKSLGSILTSEEALYVYLGIVFTTVVFVVDCWNELANGVVWSINVLTATEEPAIVGGYEGELMLMPAKDNDKPSADEILNEWVLKAMSMFGDDEWEEEDYWEVPMLCGGKDPKSLPAFKRRKGVRLIKGGK